jgi:predicted flavoprotein YhiN
VDPFGEEFVTAGGVALGDVNLATMESRRCPGLYLAENCWMWMG